MKLIKPGEYKSAICYCGKPAKWRSNIIKMKACDEHRKDLKKAELAAADEGYMTEADHQTWGRI